MNSVFNIDPSVTTAFDREALDKKCLDAKIPEGFRAVVIGGGTGAPASIKTLLSLGVSTDAVVAMADDGGSTGDLRAVADVTAPGDIRKCICAFAKDPDDPMTKAFKYRFPNANNHTLGNLMLSALEDASGSFVDAIKICEKLLDCQGHVYPSTLDHVTISATTMDGQELDGQAVLTKSKTALREVAIHSEGGAKPQAFQPAVDAILNADLIVLGPGSLFTSIIPNILIDGIRDAIANSRASVMFVCGIADSQGETWGMSASEHVAALCRHGMDSLIDYVIVNKTDLEHNVDIHFVNASKKEIVKIQSMGPVAVVRDLVEADRPTWHAPTPLRDAFVDVISLMTSRKGA